MGKVIPLFVVDEVTGLKVPNRPYRPEFIITDPLGVGYSVHKTRNEAVAKLAAMQANSDLLDDLFIVEF